MDQQQPIVAKAEMLIRKPVADVFRAFVEPEITDKFWFTSSSGRVEAGRDLKWHWEMYGVSQNVHVRAVEENRRILVEWSADDTSTTVEWTFTPRADNSTFVSIVNAGFSGDAHSVAEQAISSTEGFTLVLAGLKAFLEHGILLHLVPDRFPDAVKEHWRGRTA